MVLSGAKICDQKNLRCLKYHETFNNWFIHLQTTSSNPENPYLLGDWGLGTKLVQNGTQLGSKAIDALKPFNLLQANQKIHIYW